MGQFLVGDVVYRHGDVLLKKFEGKVGGRTQAKALLHQGQNHHHVLKGGSFKLIESEGGKTLEVKKQTVLDHEEHGPIKVAPGKYLIDIQLEYDHFLEESRQVID